MEYNIPTIFNNNFLITQFFGQNLVDYKRFGMNGHNGVDLIPTNGESWDINSVSDGVVIQTGNDTGGFGNFIKIKDGNKVWLYAHLATFCVEKHQLVKKGQLIGIMGNTGNSTGAHLHLGLKLVDNEGNALNNQNGYFGAIDPLSYLLETPVVPPEPPTPPTPQAPKDVPWKGNSYYEGFITSNNIALAVKDLTDRDIEIAALKAERDILKQEGQDWVQKVSVLEVQKDAIQKEKDVLANELKTIRDKFKELEIPKDEVPSVKTETVIVQNAEINQTSTSKPFWQSKKFWSLPVSAGIGILGSYLSPENIELILQTVAQVEMLYLGGQTLIDTKIVEIFKNTTKK